mmetsp:Transcript_9391/g.34834  ORF Transcript_9391/g.34834 Transcript_9391/m.34834 type:complete len:242 (-) Transcript_9391:2790-3515(-)
MAFSGGDSSQSNKRPLTYEKLRSVNSYSVPKVERRWYKDYVTNVRNIQSVQPYYGYVCWSIHQLIRSLLSPRSFDSQSAAHAHVSEVILMLFSCMMRMVLLLVVVLLLMVSHWWWCMETWWGSMHSRAWWWSMHVGVSHLACHSGGTLLVETILDLFSEWSVLDQMELRFQNTSKFLELNWISNSECSLNDIVSIRVLEYGAQTWKISKLVNHFLSGHSVTDAQALLHHIGAKLVGGEHVN